MILRPFRHIALAVVLAALLFAPARAAEAPDIGKLIKRGLATISTKRAKKHIAFLAGRKCQGRASGEEGCDIAADYLANTLQELGVEPAGENGSWFQEFPIKTGPFPGQGGRGPEPRQSTTKNVVGVLRGADPELQKEVMIVGGHYDHLGYRDLRKGKIYWGADDNASGCAATLLLAEAFAQAEVRPARSIMFIFFSGEERGLFGSRHYVSRPAWPIAETALMINLDMVGRNEPARMDVYGNRSSPELDAVNAKYARASRFKFEYKGGSVFRRSDHYAFYERGIPVLFFTSGMHKDYHDLDDEPRRLLVGKIERVAEHCFRLLLEIGNAEQRPTYQKIAPSGAVGVLGLVPVALSASEMADKKLGKRKGAVVVAEVMHGTPAEAANIQVGDLILGLAGKFLTDRDPMSELDALADGLERRKKVPLLLQRGRSRKTVPIEIP